MHEVIVVGVDGSPGGYAAVAEAAELARRFQARLIGLSVEEGLPRYAATMGEVDEFKEEKDRYFAEVGRRAARVAGQHGSTLEHEIPDVGPGGKGKSIANLVSMEEGEKIAALLAAKEFDDAHFVEHDCASLRASFVP